MRELISVTGMYAGQSIHTIGYVDYSFLLYKYQSLHITRDYATYIYIYISTKKDLLIVPPYNIIKWIQHKQRKTSAIRNNF